MSKLVLGKGLSALIPSDSSTAVAESKYRTIPLEQIAPNPQQPRQQFNEEALQQLARSLKENGLMQPWL